MNFPLENRVLHALLALLVLAVFYGIYFIKILAQKQFCPLYRQRA